MVIPYHLSIYQHKLLIPIFTLTLTSTLTPTPTRFGPKMGLYLSYRPLDRTKSISAPSSNFDPETKKCENRSHFWAGASLGGPGTFPGKLNFTLIHLNSFNFTLIICADRPVVSWKSGRKWPPDEPQSCHESCQELKTQN